MGQIFDFLHCTTTFVSLYSDIYSKQPSFFKRVQEKARVKKLWNTGGGQEMAVMVSLWQKKLITTVQVNLCCHIPASLGIGTWIIIIKTFSTNPPS